VTASTAATASVLILRVNSDLPSAAAIQALDARTEPSVQFGVGKQA
jgi:hypothetical protein